MLQSRMNVSYKIFKFKFHIIKRIFDTLLEMFMVFACKFTVRDKSVGPGCLTSHIQMSQSTKNTHMLYYLHYLHKIIQK